MATQIVGLVLAAMALAVAVLALIPAFRSLRVANESLVVATKAIELAQADIDNSHHDVEWAVWRINGNVILLNQSKTSAAHNVEVTLRIDEEKQETTAELVDPLKTVPLSFPRAVATYKQEVAEAHQVADRQPSFNEYEELDGRSWNSGGPAWEAFERLQRKWLEEAAHRSADREDHLLAGEVTWTTKYGIPKRQVIHDPGRLHRPEEIKE